MFQWRQEYIYVVTIFCQIYHQYKHSIHSNCLKFTLNYITGYDKAFPTAVQFFTITLFSQFPFLSLSLRPRFFLHRFIQTVANINLLDPRESRSRNISSGKGKYGRPSKFKHNPFQETGSIFELFEFRIKFFHSKQYKFQAVEIYPNDINNRNIFIYNCIDINTH